MKFVPRSHLSIDAGPRIAKKRLNAQMKELVHVHGFENLNMNGSAAETGEDKPPTL